MTDSVLMPAPVKALMARADRATSISAEMDGSVSAEVVVTGRFVKLCNPSPERAGDASRSQSGLCPYGLDGTMRSLEHTRTPAKLTRSGADPRPGATLARRPAATRWHRR